MEYALRILPCIDTDIRYLASSLLEQSRNELRPLVSRQYLNQSKADDTDWSTDYTNTTNISKRIFESTISRQGHAGSLSRHADRNKYLDPGHHYHFLRRRHNARSDASAREVSLPSVGSNETPRSSSPLTPAQQTINQLDDDTTTFSVDHTLQSGPTTYQPRSGYPLLSLRGVRVLKLNVASKLHVERDTYLQSSQQTPKSDSTMQPSGSSQTHRHPPLELPAISSIAPTATIQLTQVAAAVERARATLQEKPSVSGIPGASAPLSNSSNTIVQSEIDDTTARASIPDLHVNASHSSFTSDVPLTFVERSAVYFCGVYLPLLLSVLFRLLIGYLCTTTKMKEPFSMLSRQNGISAKDFLWINHLSANDNLAPFQAMFAGHWLMLWTSILYLTVHSLSPLAAELIDIYPSFYQPNINITHSGAGGFFPHSYVAHADNRQLCGYIRRLLERCRLSLLLHASCWLASGTS